MNTNALTVIKKLPATWTVAGNPVTEIEMRPPTLEDLIEAEKEAHPGVSPTAFNVALACRQLVRAGDFTGPFTTGHFRKLHPATWYVIRDAMEEVGKLGEATQPDQTRTV